MSRIRALSEGVIVSLTIFPFMILITLVAPRLGLTSPALPALGVFGAVILATLALALERKSWPSVGFKPPANWGRALAAGALAAIIAFAAYAGLIFLFRSAGLPGPDLTLFQTVLTGNHAVYLQFMILVVWGSAAIGEEMFARGFLLRRMEQVFKGAPGGVIIAVLAQALIFGSMHFYQGPVGMAGSALIGAIMGATFLATGRNLIAPIIAHGLIDTYFITMIYLGRAPIPGLIE